MINETGEVPASMAMSALLTIPVENETIESFRFRVRAALASDLTHLYIDTSFLMWMTKLGAASRSELRLFFDSDCAGRVHVPVWAAHEFLKHHVEDTVPQNFLKQLEEISRTMGSANTFLRPLLDDPKGPGGEDNAKLRATLETALLDLQRLVVAGEVWAKSHPQRAAEVIEFINQKGARTTHLYEQFPGLGQLGPNRYAGRLPPGFKDNHKGRRTDEADSDEPVGPDGSNRFGDLVFWHEVLAHAAEQSAKCIVVVSNDVKNDWRLRKGAAQAVVQTQGGGGGKFALPHAHPMLSLEAKVTANVDSVLLLDSISLALILADDDKKRFSGFVNVAYASACRLPSEAEVKKQRAKQAIQARDERIRHEARDTGFAFADDPSVRATVGTLGFALRSSKSMVLLQEEQSFLGELHLAGGARPVLDVMSSGLLKGKDHQWLTRVARELHYRVQSGSAGYEQALVELVAILPQLPPLTAAALYLGMLAAMYLDPDTNEPMLPPRSVVAEQLFSHQTAAFAPAAVVVLEKKFVGVRRPLYVPSGAEAKLKVVFTSSQNPDVLDELASMTLRNVELLTPAQDDEALNLRSIFSSSEVSAEALRRKACEVFAVPMPFAQVDSAFERWFTLPKLLGFKRPNAVYVLEDGDNK